VICLCQSLKSEDEGYIHLRKIEVIARGSAAFSRDSRSDATALVLASEDNQLKAIFQRYKERSVPQFHCSLYCANRHGQIHREHEPKDSKNVYTNCH